MTEHLLVMLNVYVVYRLLQRLRQTANDRLPLLTVCGGAGD